MVPISNLRNMNTSLVARHPAGDPAGSPNSAHPPAGAGASMKLDRLLFGVVFDGALPELAADARLLVAAERQLGITVHERVHPDRAGANSARDGHAGVDVAAPDPGGQAIGRVVGDAQRILESAEGKRGENRSEDLLAGDGHVFPDAADDGRLEIVAGALGQRLAPTAKR